MNLPSSVAVIAAIILLATIQPSTAQDQAAKPVEISVSYSLRITYDPDNAEAAAKSLDVGRKSMYRILGSECDLLLATIAASCRLSSAKVSAAPNRRRSRRRYRGGGENSLPSLSLRASAKLEVMLNDRRQTAQ